MAIRGESEHGRAIECPGTAPKRGRNRATKVRVPVIDDEPKVDGGVGGKSNY